jgi:hypothetical protein
MGAGSGADFCDGAIVPATLGATKIPAEDVTMTLRYIRSVAHSPEERIELLTIILGE